MTSVCKLSVAVLAGAVCAGGTQPAFAQAQNLTVLDSVVQVRCALPDGEMKATGVVWPEPGLIVTALHAVAGCEEVVVYSEAGGGRESVATDVERVHLEADLALLRLQDDLGLPAVRHADEPPNVRDPHFVWGYPLAAEQIIEAPINFAGGRSGGLTTLGKAFSSDALNQLFQAQDYPNRETQILRVTSTIQPGHSGAPIFDAEGRLIAIADGGLLGGWRTINWSIPAHVYLPILETSPDAVPESASTWASLFSARKVTEVKEVAFRPPEPNLAVGDSTSDSLVLLGTVRLVDVVEQIVKSDEDWAPWIEELRSLVGDDGFSSLSFDIFRHAQTDATVGLPSGVTPVVMAGGNRLEIVGENGVNRLEIVLMNAPSFHEITEQGVRPFISEVAARATWEGDAPEPGDAGMDADLEFGSYWKEFFGIDGVTGASAELILRIEAISDQFLGAAVYSVGHDGNLTNADMAEALMLELGSDMLTYLGPVEDSLLDRLDGAVAAVAPPASGSGTLTLVRRLPLDVVVGFLRSDHEVEWLQSVAEIKSILADPAAFADLSYDIYEDSSTGATVAVPTGMDLQWNDELQAVESLSDGGRSRLTISVLPASSFAEASDVVAGQFVSGLASWAKWSDGRSPLECAKLDVYAKKQFAECWKTYKGEDRATGKSAEMLLSVTVSQDVLLGTSVYLVGDDEELAKNEAVQHLMMEIGAEYLSDFAVY